MDTKLIQDLTTNKKFLLNFVKEWNESRLDMFALSQPNEVCLFYYNAQISLYNRHVNLVCLSFKEIL